VVEFDEPLDEAMLNRSLVVRDPQDKPVEGRIEIDRHETRWRFHPSSAWKGGAHGLAVDTVLEDMAGNSIDRPFEVDIVRPSDGTIKAKLLRLPFDVRD